MVELDVGGLGATHLGLSFLPLIVSIGLFEHWYGIFVSIGLDIAGVEG